MDIPYPVRHLCKLSLTGNLNFLRSRVKNKALVSLFQYVVSRPTSQGGGLDAAKIQQLSETFHFREKNTHYLTIVLLFSALAYELGGCSQCFLQLMSQRTIEKEERSLPKGQQRNTDSVIKTGKSSGKDAEMTEK